MIRAALKRDGYGKCSAFTVHSHGESYVCAAVSMLVINTINAVQALTQATFDCTCNEGEGRITFSLITPRIDENGREAGLLLDAMVLGLETTAAKHPEQLLITNLDKESE